MLWRSTRGEILPTLLGAVVFVPLGAALSLSNGVLFMHSVAQEVSAGKSDAVASQAAGASVRGARVASIANSAIAGGYAGGMATFAGTVDAATTAQVSCSTRGDEANCARARAAEAEGRAHLKQQVAHLTSTSFSLQAALKILSSNLATAAIENSNTDYGGSAVRVIDHAGASGPFGEDSTDVGCHIGFEAATETRISTLAYNKFSTRVNLAMPMLRPGATVACGMKSSEPIVLPQLPGMASRVSSYCSDLEAKMRCAVDVANGLNVGACDGSNATQPSQSSRFFDGVPQRVGILTEPAFSPEVAEYAECHRQTAQQGAFVKSQGRFRNVESDTPGTLSCSLRKTDAADGRRGCLSETLERFSADFIREHVGTIGANAMRGAGTSAPGGYVARTVEGVVTTEVNKWTQQLTRVTRCVAFGEDCDSKDVRAPFSTRSAARWYCSNAGSYNDVPRDRCPFYAGIWTYQPVMVLGRGTAQ